MPGVRAQTTHKPRSTESPRPTRRRIRANELPDMVKPPQRKGAAAAVENDATMRSNLDPMRPLTIIRHRTIVETALEFLQGGSRFF